MSGKKRPSPRFCLPRVWIFSKLLLFPELTFPREEQHQEIVSVKSPGKKTVMRYGSNRQKRWEHLPLQWALPKGNHPTVNNVSGKEGKLLTLPLPLLFSQSNRSFPRSQAKSPSLQVLPSSVPQLWVAQRSHCCANPTAWTWDSRKISQAHEWVVLQALQVRCLRPALPASIVLPAPPGHPREGSKCRKSLP